MLLGEMGDFRAGRKTPDKPRVSYGARKSGNTQEKKDIF